MNVKQAVEKRIIELLNERNMSINEVSNLAGISPSTVYSMLNEKSQNPGVVSIKKICDGLEISVRKFFDSELFDNLEQEIK
ncbi:MAG: helix-turn-helix transcriptional regulator [Oscillospiraceae bacterium]|nr:helix-turn-helix transcriptional regulator [Oscillospiraceae bacterium]